MKTAFTGALADDLARRPRRVERPILLVGFLDQGNLGIGYLTATLEAFGWRVIVADVEADPRTILRLARTERPILIGFSLIFQFYIRRYREVVRGLRAAGVDAHLVGADWRTIPGVISRNGGPPACAEARHLLRDLDDLPWPKRDFEPEAVLGRRVMPLLASRGCARTCSFCSIHTFYRTAPGKVVRTRRPAEVVAEMAWLVAERGISIFLFQDDDFPLFGRAWKRWTRELIAELHKADLPGRAIWKINCRADAIDEELLSEMKAAGLYLVYMGLESGDGQGLDVLDKGISVEQNLAAVATLKRLGLVFDFGFMMLDPSSSFESVRNNIAFLREISGDGAVAAVFCRMLPYDGTPIRDRLAAEGRLRGDVCNPDYDFLDPRLDGFHRELDAMMKLSGWIHGHQALSPMLNWAWNEVAVLEGLFPRLDGMADYRAALARITAASNAEVLDAVEALAAAHEAGRRAADRTDALARSAERLGARLLETRNRFVAGHQTTLLAALRADPALAVA